MPTSKALTVIPAIDTLESEGLALANKLNIITLAESLGGLKSLISCPYSMTHASVPKDEKMKLGITPNLLRFSVGIEHIDDLISELDFAIEHN